MKINRLERLREKAETTNDPKCEDKFMSDVTVTIIGAGAVGTSLGLALKQLEDTPQLIDFLCFSLFSL